MKDSILQIMGKLPIAMKCSNRNDELIKKVQLDVEAAQKGENNPLLYCTTVHAIDSYLEVNCGFTSHVAKITLFDAIELFLATIEK